MSSAGQEQTGLQPQVETACSVCGNPEHRLVASAQELEAQRRYLRLFHRRRLRARRDSSLEERADFTQHYATNIVACSGCGLVFRDPRPASDAIREAYAHDTYGIERLNALFDSQVELFRPKARLLCRWIARPDAVVLEIGSFVGGFLAAGAELGWNVIGIDPGVEVAEYCEAHGLPVLRESVDECEFARAGADCVAIWNTFDQLPDPHPALQAARRWLRPGGVLAVRVPNGECFERCMQRLRCWPRSLRPALLAAMAWNNLLSFPYLHGYSLSTLDRLMAQHDFERIDQHGDVLTRLADEQTRDWAAWEERMLKIMWKTSAAAAAAFHVHGLPAPWLDVYFRVQEKTQ